MKNFVIAIVILFSVSASAHKEQGFTLEQAQQMMSAKRESLVKSWNQLNSMSDEKFTKEVTKLSKILEKAGYKDRAAEMQTLADPAMKALALNSTKELSKDLEKNTLYLWFSMNEGTFCEDHDSLNPFGNSLSCMMDILLAVITLGDVSLDGAGEI